MHLGRIRLTGRLSTLSPLHLGSGDSVLDERFKQRRAADQRDREKAVRLNAVLRDHAGTPFIPGSSLKGLLRASVRDEKTMERVFGLVDPDEHAKGHIGRLWIHGAPMVHSPVPPDHPGWRDHAFVKAQTRIDRATGTAEDTKLFQGELVPEGTVFAFSALWPTGPDAPVADDEVADIAAALAPLLRPEGAALGRGTRQGQGRVRLELTSVVHEAFAIEEGAWVAGDAGVAERLMTALRALPPAEAPKVRTVSLRLTCDGPYHTKDAAATGPRGRDEMETKTITLLRSPDGKPRLWASSLLGSLRERAAWLAELGRLRQEGGDGAAPARPDDAPMDDRDRVVLTTRELAALSPVERLFGVAGFRGRVAVADLAWVTGDVEATKITSVSIDRFTGGARDGALFTTEVVYGTTFDVTLRLDLGRAADLAEGDARAFDALIDTLCADGLFLGAGASKGFGWFTVDRRKDAP